MSKDDEKAAWSAKRSPGSDSDGESSRSGKKTKHSCDENSEEEEEEEEEEDSHENQSHPGTSSGAGSGRQCSSSSLRRWQSKQVAQSIVDNAINKVLGDLSNSSPVHVTLGLFTPQIIENEGVAVAIRQQGLHRRRRYMAALAAADPWEDEPREKLMSGGEPEDLLNQAVSCAISIKGLASVSQE